MIHSCHIPIPPSANHIWRTVWRKAGGRPFQVRTAEYERWLREAKALIGITIPPVRTLPVAVRVIIQGGAGWRVNRDGDNCFKPILDAIKEARVIPDDSTQFVRRLLLDFLPPTRKGQEATCTIEVEAEEFGEVGDVAPWNGAALFE